MPCGGLGFVVEKRSFASLRMTGIEGGGWAIVPGSVVFPVEKRVLHSAQDDSVMGSGGCCGCCFASCYSSVGRCDGWLRHVGWGFCGGGEQLGLI